MPWGMLDLLGSFMTLVFATTIALAGGELLLRGNLFVGAGLLGVAVAMVVFEQYVTAPGDLPELVAGKVVDAVVRSPDDE